MNNKIIFWSILGLFLILFINLISNILLPFIVAIIFAYLLDPLADKLEKKNLSRNKATLIILSSFFLVLAIVLTLIIPVIYGQITNLVKKTPEYITLVNENIIPYLSEMLNKFAPDALDKAKDSVNDISKIAFSFLQKLLKNVWSSGLAIVNILSLLFVTPIVTYYILRDWDKIMAIIKDYLPVEYKETILEQVKKINITLSAYLRGQTNVCLILGFFYAICLTIANLEFGFTIGIVTGVLSFIPYVGMMFGFTIGMILAILQFDSIVNISIVAAIFIVGQLIEGNFITPKLVGDKVGLHPVWIIFSLMAGGTIFGFVGILLAIPVASVLGVLVKFTLEKYTCSEFYCKKNK